MSYLEEWCKSIEEWHGRGSTCWLKPMKMLTRHKSMWHGRGHSYNCTYENIHYAACGMVGGHSYGCTYENLYNAKCGMVGGHFYDCTYENAHMRNLSRV
jgi:hypothetical protein